MGCELTVEVAASTTSIVVAGGQPQIITSAGAPVVLELRQSVLTVEAPATPALIIEVCKQGPAGPPGESADPVCNIKPDSTLSYTGSRLTRVDYVDGRYKDLTYTGSQLTQVDCVDPSIPETVRKTLGYTGSQLTSVTTVVL